MDWISNLFLGCFLFGLVFTLASFLLGGLGHIGGMDGVGHGAGGHVGIGHDGIGHGDIGHGDIGHAGHIGHGDIGHDGAGHVTGADHGHPGGLGWFNFNALIVFLTWFGGAGFVLHTLGANAWVTLPLALLGGFLGYLAILLFLSKVLYNSQTPYMQTEDYDLRGTVARVSSPIFKGGTGEVVYTKFGTRRSAAARSENGEALPRDLQVVILREENGVVFVEELDKLLSEAGAEEWSTSNVTGSDGEQTGK